MQAYVKDATPNERNRFSYFLRKAALAKNHIGVKARLILSLSDTCKTPQSYRKRAQELYEDNKIDGDTLVMYLENIAYIQNLSTHKIVNCSPEGGWERTEDGSGGHHRINILHD